MALKLIYANINSYSPKKYLINHYLHNNDIDCIMCVETKQKENIMPYQNWTILQQTGNILNTNIRGGCLVQAKQELKVGKANPPRINNGLNNCLHFTLPYNQSKIHIFLVYVHHSSQIEETIFIKASLYDYAIIIGDFNIDPRKNKQIKNFIENSNFVKLNTPPTFIMPNNPSSTPDLILCTDNLKKNFTKVELIPDLGSDHLAIKINFDMQMIHTPTREEIAYNFNKCDIIKLNEKMEEYINRRTTEISREYVTEFNKKLADLMIENSPVKRKTKTYNYELPPFILSLIKQKRKLYREISQSDLTELKVKYNELNKTIHLLISQFKENKWLKTCENINIMKGKNYWQEIKKLSRYKSNNSTPTLIYNNKNYHTDQEKANLFAEQFEKTFQFQEDNHFDADNLERVNNWYQNYFRIENAASQVPIITEEEYFETLSTGKNTSPGHDNINRNILRKLSLDVHKEIINIYNFCIKQQYFPKEWKTGIVITIPKPNTNHSSPENYRPITLLPVLGKNLEKIIKTRLDLEVSTKIPEQQFGFRSKSSTIHPLTILVSNVQTNHLMGNKTAGLFLDIKKAFDSVWHNGLLYKLSQLNCSKYIIWLVKEFLENRVLMVKVNKTLSTPFISKQGVPQGSPLSPLLYNIFSYDVYNNPMPDTSKSYMLQFADDNALISHGSSLKATIETLQQQANNIITHCNKWRQQINPKKSQYMIFHHRIKDTSPRINLVNTVMKPSPSAKYLGINLDHKVNFKLHTSIVKKKTTDRAKHFRSLTYKNKGISIKTGATIYKMICRPIIEYGHVIFYTCRDSVMKNIEVAERNALRQITKLRHPNNPLYNPSNLLLYEKTKIEPIASRLRKLSIKFSKSEHNLLLIRPLIINLPENIIRRRFFPERTLHQILQDLANGP